MSTISITVDGASVTIEADQRPTHIFAENKEIVVARVNGVLKDLWTELSNGDVIESVSISSEDGLAVLRHSTAHVMAQAVQEVFANTKLGIGPPIKDGFYYDFEPKENFNPDDLVKIETAMRKIIKEGQRFRRRVTTEADALAELAHEPYKCELIGIKGPAGEEASVEVGGAELTIYDNLGRDGNPVWSDLCRGPHLPSTKLIPAFKLMRTAAAYWRGSEKNPMLQRIYGTAWPSVDQLNAYLELLAEAEKRDHRRLGNELDLFSFPEEIGSGLAVFHPKGGIIRRAMEDYSRLRHEEEGYDFVYSPHLTKAALFETSGHLQWYADGMYPPMILDEGGAAFYGPKISVQAKDAIGRTWQMSTIQVDFQLPQRFELEYSASDGTRQRPVMIHRALFGSIERFFGVLTEHYSGAFPPWLAPVQVIGIPVADSFADYLGEVIQTMRKSGIRAELDASDDRMQKKVRNAQMQKIPFMVIAGEEDQAAGAVSFRYRNGEQKNGIPIADAIVEINKAIKERAQV